MPSCCLLVRTWRNERESRSLALQGRTSGRTDLQQDCKMGLQPRYSMLQCHIRRPSGCPADPRKKNPAGIYMNGTWWTHDSCHLFGASMHASCNRQ